MTKKQFVNSKGETWEYEETEEMRKAVEKPSFTFRVYKLLFSHSCSLLPSR